RRRRPTAVVHAVGVRDRRRAGQAGLRVPRRRGVPVRHARPGARRTPATPTRPPRPAPGPRTEVGGVFDASPPALPGGGDAVPRAAAVRRPAPPAEPAVRLARLAVQGPRRVAAGTVEVAGCRAG